MEKHVTIGGYNVYFRIVQVFDTKLGHINEHILVVDISSIAYNKELTQQVISIVKKDYATLKAIYYRVSADNYNNIYICPVLKSDSFQTPETVTNESDLEKYGDTVHSLYSQY